MSRSGTARSYLSSPPPHRTLRLLSEAGTAVQLKSTMHTAITNLNTVLVPTPMRQYMAGLVVYTFVWALYTATGEKGVRPTSAKPFCRNTVRRHLFLSAPHTSRYIIQINQPTSCNSFTSLLLGVYVWLNMFRASPRPSSGAYN